MKVIFEANTWEEFHKFQNQNAIQTPQKVLPLDVSIDGLALSMRATNALHKVGVHTIRSLIEIHPCDFMAIEDIGSKTASEIVGVLYYHGYTYQGKQ
jgi:DNA-directed RNA polymerase alpha subunit